MSSSWFRVHYLVTMSILPKAIYRVNAILVNTLKNSVALTSLTFLGIYKKPKRAKVLLKKEKELFWNTNIYYKAIIIKIVCYCHIPNQQNRKLCSRH